MQKPAVALQKIGVAAAHLALTIAASFGPSLVVVAPARAQQECAVVHRSPPGNTSIYNRCTATIVVTWRDQGQCQSGCSESVPGEMLVPVEEWIGLTAHCVTWAEGACTP